MANQPGSLPPSHFRPGQSLTAQDLNRIVRMLTQRITGGQGIRVRGFGGQIVLESSITPPRKGGAGTPDKVGYIVSGIGTGPYVVDVYDNGIDQASTGQENAYPLSGEDFDADTAVVLVWVKAANEGAGRWYFEDPSALSSSVLPGIVSSGSGEGPYTVPVYENGLGQSSTGVVSAYAMQIAAGQSFPSGLRVMVFHVPNADSGSGRWYFQGPVWVDS